MRSSLQLSALPSPVRSVWFVAVEEAIRREVRTVPTVSVAFVSEGEMVRLNRVYRKKNGVTDVLSFDLKDSITDREGPVGEVVLCLPEVRRRARRDGRPLKQTVQYLTMHGILHILGYSHGDDASARRMEKLEENIMKTITR